MSNNLFGDDEDGEDMFDGDSDLPDEASGPKERPTPQNPNPVQSRVIGNRRVRLRPMSVSMKSKNPSISSIMITRLDGSQLLFVRK